ncbi:prephenate dehydrogenase (NADP(+)), partial [Modicella reniformis]
MPNHNKAIKAEMETLQLGIIGMGDMGKLYAKKLSAAGWKNVNVCDIPTKYDSLRQEFEGTGITVMKDGHFVSRKTTKLGAIVGGQTSVKAPEIAAFEKHLPEDVHIITCHSMHGPTVSSRGQPLVIINHRGTPEKLGIVERILSCFESEIAYLAYEEHD